jgi:hypothetical protein
MVDEREEDSATCGRVFPPALGQRNITFKKRKAKIWVRERDALSGDSVIQDIE